MAPMVLTGIMVAVTQPLPVESGFNVSAFCALKEASERALPAPVSRPVLDKTWLASLNNSIGDVVPPERHSFWNPLGKAYLTSEQEYLLKLAYRMGREDGDARHAELVQAVLMQETIAGLLGRIGHMTARVGKRSYGVMQVKVSAARDVLRHHPELGRFPADELLIARLLSDDEFNIRVGSAFLKILRKKTHSDEAALVAYNIGLRASRKVRRPQHFAYVEGVQRYVTELVRPFNRLVIEQPLTVASTGALKNTDL
ncbi:MAG TPA: lytic transglycosylase domain-containing protein [Gammaproteobacteria bacterium]|nr:lytic transglycosylase domain-containing protein [Gammaproteobacteria bacterium]